MASENKKPTDFHFDSFDPNEELRINAGNLPHWFQPNKAIFVTFRTADSLPKSVILADIKKLELWLQANGLPEILARSTMGKKSFNHDQLLMKLTRKQSVEFKKLTHRIFHYSLDKCHGACHLKTQAIAKTVSDAILKFDGTRYVLDRFVIMPNHCHVIVQFLPNWNLSTIGQSWMRYTARMINKQLGTSGSFWAREAFDHIIRSPDQFEYLQTYVKNNPAKANLKIGDYLYWQRNTD
jgi:REP element-mobilizing transposase RayT